MAALRRGFKSDAEKIAAATREELKLKPMDALDCLRLADHLGIQVVSLSTLGECGAQDRSINRLLSDAAKFSAMTICVGRRRLIVYNPVHSAGRRANSLAHELAHIILEHPPTPPIGVGGCRHWNEEHEGEADWLAAALLVPREGALRWLRNGGSVAEGASHFGVSTALFNWRINQSGVARQLSASTRNRH